MSNRKMTPEEIAGWERLYAKDLPIIRDFLLRKEKVNTYRLFFKDGTQIVADYDGCGDSDNGLEFNDPDYEDLYEFLFIVKKIENKGLELECKEGAGLWLNYHNFFYKFEPYEGEI